MGYFVCQGRTTLIFLRYHMVHGWYALLASSGECGWLAGLLSALLCTIIQGDITTEAECYGRLFRIWESGLEKPIIPLAVSSTP